MWNPASVEAATLIFDDEFNGTALDTNAWVAMNRPGDSSNNEVECYIPGNATVSNGSLALTAKVDSSCRGYSYTSAMVQWKSFQFTYGTIEYRAKMAGGTGTWPAIWLLGANCQQTNVASADNTPPCNWPVAGSDEIDMTEIMKGAMTTVGQYVHSGSFDFNCNASTSNVSQNWHTYQLDWAPGSLIWKIDGVTTCTLTRNVPSTPMFLIMNVALGGQGGTVNGSTLPQSTLVDYVRVYSSGSTASPCDLNADNQVNAVDYQIALNQALGSPACTNADLNSDAKCNVIDVQRVANAAQGQACRVGP
ncbi:MAG TPA: family 16 glycosylhydrolase [Bryobacteraceae bacterium]|jgi:beta-glucanase (GH16 family)|nr:family 16 glycosylhydrolase [Bryobacteraceae bacterium]